MNEGRPPHHRRHPSCIYVYIYLSRMARRGEPWRGCRSSPHTWSLSLSVTALNGHMFTGHGRLWSPTQLFSAIKKPFLGILEPYPGNPFGERRRHQLRRPAPAPAVARPVTLFSAYACFCGWRLVVGYESCFWACFEWECWYIAWFVEMVGRVWD